MTNKSSGKPRESSVCKFYYFIGFLTSCFIFLVFFLFLGYRMGFSNLFTKLTSLLPKEGYKYVLYLPEEIRRELIELKGVIDQAGNPTKQPRHNTIAVKPDKDLGYVLRPNVEISSNILKSIAPFNFAPPTLYLGANSELSLALRKYIEEQSRLSYTFSTDANGFRKTIPVVESDQKILIVGDSVPCGWGVNDDCTMASYLQRMVGNRFKVINAGVGGYDGEQAFRMAKKQSMVDRYSCLIYVACQNDFMESEDWLEEAKRVLEQIYSISKEFHGNVVILFHTYLNYSLHEMFLDNGPHWEKGFTEKTNLLRKEFPQMCSRLHFQYSDWTDIVNQFQEGNKSILSGFALYADYCHLSPLGNQKAAEALFKSLKALKLVG